MDPDQTQAAADRLAAKLDALDLDDDERTVLVGMLGAGATSIEPIDDEVGGFGLNANFGIKGQPLGAFAVGPAPSANESPKEEVTFEYGGLQIRYQH
jgi:hypothetical protein